MADYGSLLPVIGSGVPSDTIYTHDFRPSTGVGGLVPAFSWTRNLMVPEKPSFQQYYQAIKDIDAEIVLPGWKNYVARDRALEQMRLLRYYGGYQGMKWDLTTGSPNNHLDSLIRTKYPRYPRYFSKDGLFSKLELPKVNTPFDASHFHATLSKYLDWPQNHQYIRPDLAGWAGDMFTFARDLKDLRSKGWFGNDSLYKLADLSIGEKFDGFNHSFGRSDFYADIDARNISTLVGQGLPLHTAIENYFENDLYGRFGMFVNSYGGWKNFEKRVRSYKAFPMNPLLESIFIDAAQKAFINKVREGCLREMDCF